MSHRYVALLRAVSNVSMAPFRTAIEELGFDDVVSFGMSGNLIFTADETDVGDLELRIGMRLGKVVMIRSAPEMRRTAAADPFPRNGAVLFLKRPPPAMARRRFVELNLSEPRPVLRGPTLYFVHPVTVVGRRAPLDLEAELNVKGTARSSNVVRRIAERMT